MNVDIVNPEELFEDTESMNEVDASLVLDGARTPSPAVIMAARNLSVMLLSSKPLSLASTIAHFADKGGSPPHVANAMVDLLERKIADATPDELNGLVQEAKVVGVWTFIKPAIMARNDALSEQISKYTNLDALIAILPTLATSANWLPGPIFAATTDALRQMATVANITVLDRIAETALIWRMKGRIKDSLIARNRELVKEIATKYIENGGWRLHKGSERVWVDRPMKALRLEARGYEFVVESTA